MDYEPIARLGRGGMGVVDLARDADGTRVAMKRLTLHGSASEIGRARQRLLREADVLRRLHHPNIVRLIEVVDDGDELVLVMPYLSGGNLAERVAQHGPAPPADVELLGERLLGALAAAHQAGIIHRDIKPANVLYDSNGEPMLADFGLAHTWDQTKGLTMAGMVVGTPGYMPPEQARDEHLTPASDIFSLGATLLFAATGKGPYGSGDPALLMVRSANDEVERLPKEIPKAMRGWMGRMLDPKPENRPTAVALLTGQGLIPGRHHRRLFRLRNLAIGATIAAAVFAGFLAIGRSSNDDTRIDDDPPRSEPDDRDREEVDPGGVDPGGNSPENGEPERNDPGGDRDIFEAGDLVAVEEGLLTWDESEVVYRVPAMTDTKNGCDRPQRIILTVSSGIVANVALVGPGNHPLDEAVARDGRPATIAFTQDTCVEPSEDLYVYVALEGAVADEPPQGSRNYVLSREVV